MDPVTPVLFRADFPAFGNTVIYPDSSVTTWLTVGAMMLDPVRWGDLYNIGLELFAAHNLVLDGMGNAEGQRGGLVGFAKGPVSGETGDKVSVTYDPSAAMLEGAGHWNLTTYGLRYLQLARLVGMGPVQVSPCGPLNNQLGTFAPAWSGPMGGVWF